MYESNWRWQATAGSLCLLLVRIATEGYAQSGNRIEATTKWIFGLPSASGSPQSLYLEEYDERFVREDGRWRFLPREAFIDLPVQPEAGTQ